MQNKLSGYLKKIYRRDEKTGITYFGIETEELDVIRNSDGFVYASGIIPKWPADIFILTEGIWDDNNYKVTTIKPYTETEAISKKLLKNIVEELKDENEDFTLSAAGIKKILSVTGIDILSFIKKENAKEILNEKLLKIDPKKIDMIYEKLQFVNESYLVNDYIIKFGCTSSHCVKLVAYYGESALQAIKAHPYKIGHSVGMDFFTSDRIGKDVSFDALATERIEALIYTAISNELDKTGSTYVPKHKLEKNIVSLCKKSSYPNEIITSSMIALTINNMSGIIVEKAARGVRIYRKSLYESEKIISSNLKRLNDSSETYEFDETTIEEAEKYLKIKYSEKQKESFNALRSSGIKIITGGPGTGKTTVVNGILYLYKKMHPNKEILLCAPTGRASQRMSEVTKMEASTIHRTLDFRPYGDGRLKCKDKESQLNGDLIVLDEMSMVDTEIFSLLLPAIKSGGTLILLGDENQLQSVSSGNILHDLIESESFETYRLVEVFRQKGKQTITDNAYKILDGKMNFEKDESFSVELFEDTVSAVEKTVKMFDEFYKKNEEKNIQILSPTRVGDGGTNILNSIIAKRINDIENENENENENEEKEPTFYKHHTTTYRKNNKVIFSKNNYEKEYYNGDIGYISRILKNGFIAQVGEKEIRITGECLNEVSLAYAITVHKSQGSEADGIIILLPDTYTNMLDKNMLFTAVTRAKKFVHILYVNSALYDAVTTYKVDKRNTGLTDKIKGTKREVLN